MHFCIKVLKCSSRAMWRAPAWRITQKANHVVAVWCGRGRWSGWRCTLCASMSPIIMVLWREPELRIMWCVRIDNDSRITLLVRPVLLPQALTMAITHPPTLTHTHIHTNIIKFFALAVCVCMCVCGVAPIKDGWQQGSHSWVLLIHWVSCDWQLQCVHVCAWVCVSVYVGVGVGVERLPYDGWVAAATHVADALGHHCWQQYQRQQLHQQQQEQHQQQQKLIQQQWEKLAKARLRVAVASNNSSNIVNSNNNNYNNANGNCCKLLCHPFGLVVKCQFGPVTKIYCEQRFSLIGVFKYPQRPQTDSCQSDRAHRWALAYAEAKAASRECGRWAEEMRGNLEYRR